MNQAHYPDIDRCKKLQEIGFPNTEMTITSIEGDLCIYGQSDRRQIDRYFKCECYICPSVMEMLDVIPSGLLKESGLYDLRFDKNTVSYMNPSVRDLGSLYLNKIHETLPSALAGMIIWLVENGHFKFNTKE